MHDPFFNLFSVAIGVYLLYTLIRAMGTGILTVYMRPKGWINIVKAQEPVKYWAVFALYAGSIVTIVVLQLFFNRHFWPSVRSLMPK